MTNDTAHVLPGAEAWSHTAPDPEDGPAVGFLALHGFTGNPSSMRGFAEAAAGAGLHVELPRLPGHGTTIEEMQSTSWPDWSGEVEAAYQRLAERAQRIVAGGLSMGGALTLWAALAHSEIAAIVCVNPLTRSQPDEVRAMLDDFLRDGTLVVPGIGSDIADPEANEIAYEGTPVAPLVSLLDDGVAPIAGRYGELKMPLLLWTSRQDHVVEASQSEHLAATYGGEVDHRWLERSYHVATKDFDRDLIFVESLEFIRRLTAGDRAAP